MFILYNSNRTETLVQQLGSVISSGAPLSLFQQELFLIQSRGMERMLSQHLAETFGVWANTCFFLPIQFIEYLVELTGHEYKSRSFDRDILIWRLESLLRNIEEPGLSPLARYLKGDQLDVKRFQLARQLAHLFDQYQILRVDFLDSWDRDLVLTIEPEEIWQKLLWRKLRENAKGSLHRGELISRLIADLGSNGTISENLPQRMFVFGLHTMPPLFFSILNVLSRLIDIHLFLLSPCSLYWGDLETEKVKARRRVTSYQNKITSLTDESGFHPLLSNLGKQGAHFQELLLERIDLYEEGAAHFINPHEDSPSCLLNYLQADMLEGLPPPDADNRIELYPDDSIMIISCHSRMREIMVLKDYIMSWLYADESLELHDIVVMAPDIQSYSALIPSVFHDIPHSVADRTVRKENKYFDSFLQYLDLFSGRFGWSELLSVLEKPEVRRRFELSASDIEMIRYWVVDSGIRWGLSEEQRINDGLGSFDLGSWRNGLERMLMGVAIDTNSSVDGILPYTEIEGSSGDVLGALCQFIDLVEESYVLFQEPGTLADWSERLRSICSDLLIDNAQPDLLALNRLFSELSEELYSFHGELVSFTVIKSWLESTADSGSTAGFLTGNLMFCSMLPMRSIPFRVICLLGLNDGEFPRNDHFSTFDLTKLEYRIGDRSNRDDDRYQFLEALIAARERLYLSYIGQSIRTNRKIPPSVVVTELNETLQNYYALDDVTVFHPLRPFSASYYTGSERLFSYDEYYCRVAQALSRDDEFHPLDWFTTVLVDDPQNSFEISDILQFFSQPQIYFVRTIMGIDYRIVKDIPDEDEPFQLDGLARYSTDQQIVQSILSETASAQVRDRLQACLQWPLGEPGNITYKIREKELHDFVTRVGLIDLGKPLSDRGFDMMVGDNFLTGTLPNAYQEGQLYHRYAALTGKDILHSWLYHLIAKQMRQKALPTYFVSRDCTLTIAADCGEPADLSQLVEIFIKGRQSVSALLVEPAFAYAQQIEKNRRSGRRDPLEAARALFRLSMEKGYTPEWNLLYEQQPIEAVLGAPFEDLAKSVMVSLWDRIQVQRVAG